MLIPIRIGLVSPEANCAFNIAAKFLYPPRVGEKIVLDGNTLRIVEIFHFLADDPTVLVRVTPLTLETQDQFYKTLDHFKAKYELYDLVANNEQTESYYMFFRKVVNLLGLQQTPNPYLEREDKDALRIFAEAARAVLLAEFEEDYEAGFVAYNGAIEQLLRIAIARKAAHEGNLEIYPIIKEWETVLNHSGQKWTASLDKCRAAARISFARLRSIAPDKLPSLEETP
jgi:hypothetical protein